MVVTVVGHPLIKGDRIRFEADSLTFTCAKDNNATQHTYPRGVQNGNDPANNAWLTIDAVTNETYTVFVGASSDCLLYTSDADDYLL